MTHVPNDETRAQVSALTAFGVPHVEICEFIGVSDNTLRKHYSEELTKAATEKNSEVAAFLYRSASGKAIAEGASYSDCLKAAMFWLKTRARWRETNNLEISGPDGGPIQTATIDPSKLSADAMREILAATHDTASDADQG